MKSQKFYEVILAGSLASSLLCVGLTGSAAGQTVTQDAGAQEIQKAIEMWKEDDIAVREEGTSLACSLLEKEKKRIHAAVVEELGELAFATFDVDRPSRGEERTEELEKESPVYEGLRGALGSADAEVRARAQDLLCEKCDACGTRFAEGLCPGCAPVFVLPEPEPEPEREPGAEALRRLGEETGSQRTGGMLPGSTTESIAVAQVRERVAKVVAEGRAKEAEARRRAELGTTPGTGPELILVVPQPVEGQGRASGRASVPMTAEMAMPTSIPRPRQAPPPPQQETEYVRMQRQSLGLDKPPQPGQQETEYVRMQRQSLGISQYHQPSGRQRTKAAPTEGAASPWVQIQIAFQEKAPEQAIRELVLALQGTIVEGPTALGVYTVELAVPREAAADLEPILEELRGYTEVVRLVERQY